MVMPSVSVHLFGDGRVAYHGDLHVSVLGARSYRIEPLPVTELAMRFYEEGFFNYLSSHTPKEISIIRSCNAPLGDEMRIEFKKCFRFRPFIAGFNPPHRQTL